MNQLILDVDYLNLKSHSYTYDIGGNILSEETSDIDTNEIVSNTTTINYGYSDSNWADKLTSYNGQKITYDEIGNPLTYSSGMTMTWKNGRQLSTLQKGNDSVNYEYGIFSVGKNFIIGGSFSVLINTDYISKRFEEIWW